MTAPFTPGQPATHVVVVHYRSGGMLGAPPNSPPLNGALPDSAGPGRRLTGPGAVIPVDVWVPGSPPSPFAILNALLMAVGKLAGDRAARNGTEAGA